jgi:hypothetical protein
MSTVTKPRAKSKQQHNVSKSAMQADTPHNTAKTITHKCCYMIRPRRSKHIKVVLKKGFLALGHLYKHIVDQRGSRPVAWDVMCPVKCREERV